jgi:uncharacterized membrane protein
VIGSLGGLPTHPLLVHIPVVLVPLAAIGAIAMAIRPAWLERFGVVVTVIAGVGFVGAAFAADTGESLLDTFRSQGVTIPDSLNDHAEMGENVAVFAGVFFVLLLAWVLFAWWRRRAGEEKAVAKVRKPKLLAIVLSILVVLAGVGSTVSVTLTGHSGAKSVWDRTK